MVGQGASLTRVVLAAMCVAAGAATAQSPEWQVDGTCRDGQPHGRYELRSANGTLRVTGAFNHGKRTGSFIFWSASGARVAHIPYDEDVRNGTLATWYEPRDAATEPLRRVESMWRHGERDGLTRSWHSDGHRRTQAQYEHGRAVTAAGWLNTGTRLSERQARDLALRDAAGADREYAELETLLQEHLPHCD
jgi:hypothetical protein